MTKKGRSFAYIIILTLSGLLSCKTKTDDQIVHILRPGLRLDSIELTGRTLTDIKDMYGQNLKADTFFMPILNPLGSVDSISYDKSKIYAFRLFYDTLGISFYFEPESNKITAFRVEKPFASRTEKEIYLNTSTFEEVVKTYGDSPWEFTGNYIAKEYNGIRFYRQCNLDMATPDSILNNYLDSAVTEISVYEIRQ